MRKTWTGVQLGREDWHWCCHLFFLLCGEKILKSQGFCHFLGNILPIRLSHSSIGMFEILTMKIHWDTIRKSPKQQDGGFSFTKEFDCIFT